MSFITRSLRSLVSHRQSIIASASSQLTVVTQNPQRDVGKEVTQTVPSAAVDPLYVETKYGIRLEVVDEEAGMWKISRLPQQTQELSESTTSKGAAQVPRRWHYRLFPDWQTSYLWYHPSHHKIDVDIEDSEIELEDIEKRYPAIWPYYESWRETFETEFEKQECHLGSNAEVFPDAADGAAWDVEGLLIAYWLSWQDDVHSIEYMPRGSKYQVEQGKIERDVSNVLQGIWREAGPTAKLNFVS